MTREIRANVDEIELKELAFKNDDEKHPLVTEKKISYELEGSKIKYICDFEFKLGNLQIEAKYSFIVSLQNIENEEILEFISEEEDDLLFPVYSKMCGLIVKVTDEVTPFPFVGPPDMWMTETEEINDKKRNSFIQEDESF